MSSLPTAVIMGAGIVDVPAGPVDPADFGRASLPAERITLGFGGDALNEATALARLGAPVRLVSKVGADPAGELVLAHCRGAGVDTRFMRVEPGLDTGVNIVLVDGAGERRFITSRSGSLRQLALADVDYEAFGGAGVFCLASVFVSPLLAPGDMAALFRQARRRGLVTCADFTTPKNGEDLSVMGQALAGLDYAFPNLAEAAALTGRDEPEDMARALLECGVGNVVVKLGGAGCLIANGQVQKRLPAVAGVTPLDTTGAGDSFVAGFLYGLLKGRPFEECALFANAAASLAVESFGASGGIRDAAQVRRRYEAYRAQLGL